LTVNSKGPTLYMRTRLFRLQGASLGLNRKIRAVPALSLVFIAVLDVLGPRDLVLGSTLDP
jgi:hypothetical protein